MKINILTKLVVLLCVILFGNTQLCAQTKDKVKLNNISVTARHPWRSELFIYGYWETGNNRIGDSYEKKFFLSTIHLGLSAEFRKWDLMGISADVGYEKDKYAANKNLDFRSGAVSDWLTANCGISCRIYDLFILSAGFKSKTFLNNKSYYSTGYDYLSIKPDCFNKMSVGWFVGFGANIHYVMLNFRLGTYIVPMLNPDKLAYYYLPTSSHQISVSNFYMEVGVKIRIFTNSDKYRTKLFKMSKD